MRQGLQLLGLVGALAVGLWVVWTTDERAGLSQRGPAAPPRAATELESAATRNDAVAATLEARGDGPGRAVREGESDAQERARMEEQIAALLAKDAPPGSEPRRSDSPHADTGSRDGTAPQAQAQAQAEPEVVVTPEQPVQPGKADWSYSGPESLQPILDVALPVARGGNAVAANVARQAMLALDQKPPAYDELEHAATRPLSTEQEQQWLADLVSRANAGDPFAAHVYGTLLLLGRGVEASPLRAQRLLEQAARSEAWAAFLLGELYARGEGFEKDEKLAEKHYRQAAIKGLPRATRALYGR